MGSKLAKPCHVGAIPETHESDGENSRGQPLGSSTSPPRPRLHVRGWRPELNLFLVVRIHQQVVWLAVPQFFITHHDSTCGTSWGIPITITKACFKISQKIIFAPTSEESIFKAFESCWLDHMMVVMKEKPIVKRKWFRLVTIPSIQAAPVVGTLLDECSGNWSRVAKQSSPFPDIVFRFLGYHQGCNKASELEYYIEIILIYFKFTWTSLVRRIIWAESINKSEE